MQNTKAPGYYWVRFKNANTRTILFWTGKIWRYNHPNFVESDDKISEYELSEIGADFISLSDKFQTRETCLKLKRKRLPGYYWVSLANLSYTILYYTGVYWRYNYPYTTNDVVFEHDFIEIGKNFIPESKNFITVENPIEEDAFIGQIADLAKIAIDGKENYAASVLWALVGALQEKKDAIFCEKVMIIAGQILNQSYDQTPAIR